MEISTKSKIKKIILVLILLIIAYFVFDTTYFYGKKWWGERRVQKLAETLEKYQQDLFNKKAADKIGGKTPQETLQMFIGAVEKGDYELASKYFVIDRQEVELESLKTSKKENIENIINILKKTTPIDEKAILEKMYKNDVKQYHFTESKDDYIERVSKIFADHKTMTTKVNGYNFNVSFILYPSGNWKIEEI